MTPISQTNGVESSTADTHKHNPGSENLLSIESNPEVGTTKRYGCWCEICGKVIESTVREVIIPKSSEG